jgi:anti-sigma B factor antagonist
MADLTRRAHGAFSRGRYPPDRKGIVDHPVAEDSRPAFTTAVTAPGGAVVVALDGDLDIASVPALRERLLRLLGPGASRLVADMSAVRYADASGLEVLLSTQRRAVLLGGTLRLAALRPEVAEVLNVTGLSRQLATYPTVEAAMAGWGPTLGIPVQRAGSAVPASRVVPVQAAAGLDADHGELQAAVADLLASADAWHDADPRRRFTGALKTLAQADAGTSHAALVQAARSLLFILRREPLTYSPAVAATAGRLRRLFPAGPRLAVG